VSYRAFVALSGGGAKGIVHVGALKALEERHVQLLGLSGTSAGSIVATLAAAGFTADEIINAETGLTILEQLSVIDPKLKRATDLFGGRWWLIKTLRFGFSHSRLLLAGCVVVWFIPPILAALLWRLSWPGKVWIGIAAWLLMGLLLAVIYCGIVSGLARLDRFRNALAVLLQRKMFPNEPGRVVRMSDFAQAGRPSLKIVSANLTRRVLHLFSPERTPQTAVADAVAASICLPVIFRPWEVDGELHVDGGIVSNLPAWPFDEERELDPEALTVAIEIQDIAAKGSLNRFTWPSAAIRTALFGSSELNVRVSGPAEHLSVPTRFELLDFDKSGLEAAKEVGEIAAATGVWLDKRLLRLPEIYRNACLVTQALVLDGLEITPGGQGEDARVRVAVGRLEREYVQSLRMSHSVGFEDDPDEAILMPLEGTVAGAAWKARRSFFETHPFAAERDLRGASNRLRRKLTWQGLAWRLCIPILSDDAEGTPRLLVQIDGNRALTPSSETDAALQGVEEAVKEFFRLVLSELKEIETPYVPET
jgi:NTE family protein